MAQPASTIGRHRRRFIALVLALSCVSLINVNAQDSLRIATYNASLYGKNAGEIRDRLRDGRDSQAAKIAAIVQSIRPDILLINEIDYEPDEASVKLLAERFFAVGQGKREGIVYPYWYAIASNTGIDSQLDLDNDQRLGEPTDAWGYGTYPGQYAMAIFSRYPIDVGNIRTFQRYRWSQLPDALRPVDPATQEPYYSEEIWRRLRLSSKNHVDVPVVVGSHTIHVLASHPTPPVFDGDEDRNGRRNHDEIRFWSDYLKGPTADYLVDDSGKEGGLPFSESFVVLGDLNSDPSAGDSRQEAIHSLLADARIQDPAPKRDVTSETLAGSEPGPAPTATASFGGQRTMRIDYVLPSRSLSVKQSGVYWPRGEGDDRRLISASDHRLVWVEVELP